MFVIAWLSSLPCIQAFLGAAAEKQHLKAEAPPPKQPILNKSRSGAILFEMGVCSREQATRLHEIFSHDDAVTWLAGDMEAAQKQAQNLYKVKRLVLSNRL